MSTPPYPGFDPFSTSGSQSAPTRPPIKYVWPKRIAVILAGLAIVGGIGFGVKTLLAKDDAVSTTQETVQEASPAPSAPSQASPAPGGSQAPTAPTAPMKLNRAITDSAGTLNSEQTAEVESAVNELNKARDVRMWVVYVDAFDSPPLEWTRKSLSLTKAGDRDAILAIATRQRKYAFVVAPAAAGGSEQAVNELRRNQIEPRLRDNDFAGAAVAAATGLQALG